MKNESKFTFFQSKNTIRKQGSSKKFEYLLKEAIFPINSVKDLSVMRAVAKLKVEFRKNTKTLLSVSLLKRASSALRNFLSKQSPKRISLCPSVLETL